ncbi:MAG TPA: hypothetical protein VKZ63_10985 [Kofleriaceae bacterium]|nr:hypothetical protein [Kofleriaceae bacterium]
MRDRLPTRRTPRAALAVAAALAAATLAACAPAWKQAPHDQRFQRAPAPILHRPPAPEALPGDWWDRAHSSSVRPLARAVSPARWLAGLAGGPEALDVNAFGEVPDSTWFENRIGRRPMTPEEIAHGPGLSEPAPGPLVVVSGKLQGATPGIVVRDSKGTIWYLKIDPPAYREMATGAEIVAQRLLHAAGYLVPEMQIVDLAVDRLVVEPGSLRVDDYNRMVPLTRPYLQALIANLNPTAEGRIRTLVSRQVPGTPIGPFRYRGFRIDDPNDRIPHERRRSLRGLWLLSAWLNNTDVRQQNTLDSFIVVDQQRRLGYVRHHLIDFGDSLGAAGERDKYLGEGYEGHIDWPAILGRLFGGGLVYPYWLGVRRSPYRTVGLFEAEVFDPARWSPGYPNPAFDAATPRDTFWAASLLARLDREHVAAAIEAARYSEPGAAAYVLDVLMKRREKLLRHAFRRVVPLVDPEVAGTTLRLRDLGVATGLVAAASAWYRFEVRWNRSGKMDCLLAQHRAAAPEIDLAPALARASELSPGALTRDPFVTVSVWRVRHGRRGPRLDVHLRVVDGGLLPVGLWREVE